MLISAPCDFLNTLRWSHVFITNAPEPVSEQLLPDGSVGIHHLDLLSPAWRKRVKRRLFAADVPSQVPLQVLDTDVNQHVHSLDCSQSLNNVEWKAAKIVWIEKRKMQTAWAKLTDNLRNRRFRRPVVGLCGDAQPRQPYSDCLNKSYVRIADMDFGKWSLAFNRFAGGNDRTAIDDLFCLANPCSSRPAKNINKRSPARSGDELFPRCSADINVFAYPRMLFSSPWSYANQREAIVRVCNRTSLICLPK